jgi:hypothetical protein
MLVTSFIGHGEKDDGLRRSDQQAFTVRRDLRSAAKTLGRLSFQGACCSRGMHSRRQMSALGQGYESDFFVPLTVNSSRFRQHLNQWRQG